MKSPASRVVLTVGVLGLALAVGWVLLGILHDRAAYSKLDFQVNATITDKTFAAASSSSSDPNAGHRVVFYKIDNLETTHLLGTDNREQERVRIDKQGDRFTWIDPPCFDALQPGDKLSVAYSIVEIYDVEFVTRHPDCAAIRSF